MFGQSKHPRNWQEMSFDFRLFVLFHACMMGLMLARFALSVGIIFEIEVVCCAIVVIVVLSMQNRRKHGWRWQGTKLTAWLGALGLAALTLFFLGATLPGTTSLNPSGFPWFAMGGGILVFGVLSCLHVVHSSEEDFLRCCDRSKLDEPQPPQRPQSPPRKKAMVTAFRIFFLVVWIAGVSYFWTFNAAYRSASKEPTATQTEKLTNHGHTVYITPEQKKRVFLLRLALWIGFPSVIVIGACLQFGLGVKVIPVRGVMPQ